MADASFVRTIGGIFFFFQNVCGLSPFDLLWIRLNVTNAATAGVVAP